MNYEIAHTKEWERGLENTRIFVYWAESQWMHSCNYICIQYLSVTSAQWNAAFIHLFLLFSSSGFIPNLHVSFFSHPDQTLPHLILILSPTSPLPHPALSHCDFHCRLIDTHVLIKSTATSDGPSPVGPWGSSEEPCWGDERRWNEVLKVKGVCVCVCNYVGASFPTWRNLTAG